MRRRFFVAGLLAATAFAASAANLAEAASAEDWSRVRSLLAEGVAVDQRGADAATALLWAAHFDNLEMVRELLAAGASPGTANRYGVTPLSEAAGNGNAEMLEALLQANSDPNRPTMEGETPLMTAARTGNARAIEVLLDHGAAVNAAEDWRGQTPLMWAAAEGHVEAIALLLDRGADIDARSRVFDFTGLAPKPGSLVMNFPRGGLTPLLFAARQGHMDAVRVLIRAGASIGLADPDGITPLLISIINFHYDVAAFLIENGADVNTADHKGRMPLYAAVDMKNLDESARPSPGTEDKLDAFGLIKLLLGRGAAVNARLFRTIAPRGVVDGLDVTMSLGATPFLRAARSSDLETMHLLLKHGADPAITTGDGAGAIHLVAGLGWRDGKTRADETDSVKAIRWLADLGLPVNARTARSGQAPLHGAARRGADLVVQTLAELGAEINAKDRENRTPLDVASGSVDILEVERVYNESTVKLLTRLGGVTGLTVQRQEFAGTPGIADPEQDIPPVGRLGAASRR